MDQNSLIHKYHIWSIQAWLIPADSIENPGLDTDFLGHDCPTGYVRSTCDPSVTPGYLSRASITTVKSLI